MTPEEVRIEIIDILNQLRKAPDAVQDAQVNAEQAALESERAEALAFMEAVGNIEERKAQARIATSELKLEATVKAAAFKRAVTKTQVLRDSLVANQALLKSIQAEGA